MHRARRDNGEVRYVNSSGYGADSSRKAGAIKREVYVSDEVLDEVARQVNESMILGEKRVAEWPEADETGKQILTFKLASGEQGYFTTTKLGSLSQVERTKDPEGLKKVSSRSPLSARGTRGESVRCCSVRKRREMERPRDREILTQSSFDSTLLKVLLFGSRSKVAGAVTDKPELQSEAHLRFSGRSLAG